MIAYAVQIWRQCRETGYPPFKERLTVLGSSRRPTLKDIAARVKVSESAASLALSGKPGVSEATRKKVIAVAEEMGWAPNYAARTLSGFGSRTVGVVLSRDVASVGAEAYFIRFLMGLQSVLAPKGYEILLKSVVSLEEELAVYRNWQATGRVDAVVLSDLRVDDPRPAMIHSLGMKGVIAGIAGVKGPVPTLGVDDGAAMDNIVEYLRDNGHERMAYICGSPTYLHIAERIAHFEAVGEAKTITTRVRPTDFSAESGVESTEAALEIEPTVLIFDNEFLALSGISVLRSRGLRIPDDVSVVVWEDSSLMELATPPLTAVHRDAFDFGEETGKLLLATMESASTADVSYPLPRLAIRDSVRRLTGPPLLDRPPQAL